MAMKMQLFSRARGIARALTGLSLLMAFVAVSAQDLGLPLLPGGIGGYARVMDFPNDQGILFVDKMVRSVTDPNLAALDLGGQDSIAATDFRAFWGISDPEFLNGGAELTRLRVRVGLGFEFLDRQVYALYFAAILYAYSNGFEGPPCPESLTPIGSDLPLDMMPASHDDSPPIPPPADFQGKTDLDRAVWMMENKVPFSLGPFAPDDTVPTIGMVDKDSASIVVQAGDPVPNRPVEPPPGTGTTFNAFDPAGLSINPSYVAFYANGDFFQGIYAKRTSDGKLFAAAESFTLDPTNLGFIWGAFLSGERDIFFSADAGIYRADAEGASDPEVILAKGTEFEPGKTFNSGTLLHVAGNYGVIAGVDGDGKSTIFRLNLTDFTLEQIVQQGDAAPGGGTFGLVQRPAVSDRMVTFEGFDDSFQFLGLFAYLLESKELKAIARVGDLFDGKEVRTIGSFPGALNGSVVGFLLFFTDNSSAAYVNALTPAPFSNPALNISTRFAIGSNADEVGIGGFINVEKPSSEGRSLALADTKKVVVRAIGPSLGGFGVADPLADPVLELHDGTGALIASNDDWRDEQEQEIIETGLAPGDDLEAAIVTDLAPGAYTAIVKGKNGTTGVALVEIYDLDGPATSELANISTRSFVQTGDNVMIGGVIVGGEAGTGTLMVVRAIGPSLEGLGVANALQDPVLELYDSSGALLASNNDWKETQQAELEAAGLAPGDDRESALVTALGPGAYTAIVRGAGDSTGVALVEAYNLEASGQAASFRLTNRK